MRAIRPALLFRPLLSMAALALAIGGLAAAGDDDGNGGGGGRRPPTKTPPPCPGLGAAPASARASALDAEALGRVMRRFSIDQPYFKNARDFFNKANGGSRMKTYYSHRSMSRREPHSGNVPDKEVDYKHDHLRPTAVVFVPRGFDEDQGEGWGVFLHFAGNRSYGRYGLDAEAALGRHAASFAAGKLVFAAVSTDETFGDLRTMALSLDLLASLRREYPALDAPAAKERTFAGGVGDGGRMAGVFALNFTDEVRGLLMVDDGPVVKAIRESGGENPDRYWHREVFRAKDIPYLSERTNRLRKVRVVGCSRQRPASVYHEYFTYVMADYKRSGFKTRYFEDQGLAADAHYRTTYGGSGVVGGEQTFMGFGDYMGDEWMDKSLAFLSGDNEVEQPKIRVTKKYKMKY